jgi:hypothetical protein
MAIDPNIILQAGRPQTQIDNPLDVAQRALTVRQLQQRAQLQDQEIAANTATKNAYNQAIVKNADGSISVDPNKLTGALADQGYGQQALQQSQALAQNTLAQQKAQMQAHADQVALGKQLLAQVQVGPGVSPEQTQQTWLQQKQLALKYGLPNAQNLPDQFPGMAAYNTMLSHLSTAEEQLAQRNKEIDQTTERAKANAQLAEAGQPTLPAIGAASSPTRPGSGNAGPAQANGGFNPPPKMQQKAIEDYTNSVAGSRQQDDAKQALKDIQAGQKLAEIANHAPGGDLNKLNPQQMKLAITEVVKMAGGGVPTEGELEKMTPDNYAQQYAGLLQRLTNKSQPANAGEFIQQAIDYAGGIQKLGAQKLYDRANEIADNHRRFLGEEAYKRIKGQIQDEFKRNSPEKAKALAPGGVYKTHEIEWAD